ncbi:MAG: DUF3012 domain-containing protein [Kangiellaceae bacterium]|nr:DUF3012 domain-containing protein [Kangiellaceae bacterium]
MKTRQLIVRYLSLTKWLIGVAGTVLLLSGCAPEVGSDEWCEDMKEKDKGDWTANEAKDFAKHCLFKKKD